MAIDTAPPCVHLDSIHDVHARTEGCEECLAEGMTWVHLRMCLSCGHVGCCNESRGQHSMFHHHETGHPIVRSFEPGEDWMWCYVDGTVITRPGDAIDKAFSKEVMRRLMLFEGLRDEDLELLYTMTEPLLAPAGETLMREGDPGDSLYVILDGEVEITQGSGANEIVLATRGSGEFIGEMGLLEKAPRSATVRAVRNSMMLKVSNEAFDKLVECSPAATKAMVRTIMQRLRETRASMVQQAKMAALGGMSAGLAHELNNPSAAIQRSTTHLRDGLTEWEDAVAQLAATGLTDHQRERLAELRQQTVEHAGAPPITDPLIVGEREDEIGDWLEDHDVERPWETAPALVAAGWTLDAIEALEEDFSEEQMPGVARWLAATASTYGLLEEVGQSGRAISDIVRSVKTYSYLDQAPVQEVDVHESLENTLVMLKHKLRSGVTVHRQYAENLPRIEAFGSELNQAWTNLIDNAIDAMNGHGEVTLSTSMDGDRVVVEISDTGPGIPEDVQIRMYEPFFTTKPPGVGSGLGLHIVYNTVVLKHHGTIKVYSSPNGTCFRISLRQRLN